MWSGCLVGRLWQSYWRIHCYVNPVFILIVSSVICRLSCCCKRRLCILCWSFSSLNLLVVSFRCLTGFWTLSPMKEAYDLLIYIRFYWWFNFIERIYWGWLMGADCFRHLLVPELQIFIQAYYFYPYASCIRDKFQSVYSGEITVII